MSRLRAVVVLSVALALLLAGCIGFGDEATDGDPSSETTETTSTDAAQSTESGETTDTGRPAHDEAFRLSTAVDDPARIAAYEWTVPEEAVIEHPWDPFDEDPTTVILEGVPEVVGDEDPSWGLFAFRLGDQADPVASVQEVPVTIEGAGLASSSENRIDPSTSPFSVYLGYDDLVPGDEVGLVLAARGDGADRLNVTLRTLNETPSEDHRPPEDLDQLTTTANGTVPLASAATGAGFQAASYVEFSRVLKPVRWRAQTPSVTVDEGFPEETRPPLASARSTTLETEFAADGGWSFVVGTFLATSQVSQWDAAIQAHGSEIDRSGTIASTPVASTWPVLGHPLFSLQDGGPGDSQGRFHVEGTSVDDRLYYFHQGLGESPTSLFGVPATEVRYPGDGLVTEPAVTATGDQLTILGPSGVGFTILGLAASGELPRDWVSLSSDLGSRASP